MLIKDFFNILIKQKYYMKIRLADENDVNGIKKLIDKNFDEIIAEYHSQTVVDKFKNYNSIESLKAQLRWKTVYVACSKDLVAATGAFANFGTEENPKYSVSNFYVLPDLHKKGIGTEIMKILIAKAMEKSAKTLHVPSTRNAVPFYEKCGFAVDDIQPETEDEITWMTMRIKY